jgi:hypothetical protein
MATSFDGLVQRCRQLLMGFTKTQESMSELAANMGATDTTFTVDATTVTNIGRGLVEIDDELILVKAFDSTSGTVTVMGLTNGRGREGTVAASHSAHALVTQSPVFPRARIKEAINDTIRGLYPDLPVFGSTEITKLAPVFEYPLPAEAADVWYVTGQLVGPTKIWQPLPNWRFNPQADTTTGDFPDGKSIQIFDFVTPGRAMKVVYTKEPTVLTNNSDDFAGTTGYPERCVDMVTYGAVGRLLGSYEPARLQQTVIETVNRAQMVPAGASLKAAQYFLALYSQRLEEEKSRLWTEQPFYQTFQGS